MYFIDDPKELHGKTIAYVNMNQFAERILIATTDGGILTVSQYSGEEFYDNEIEVHHDYDTERYIRNCITENKKYIYDNLINYSVFTKKEHQELIDKYNKQQKEKEIKNKERQKQAELEQYLKLKTKYENLEVK